MMLGALDYDLDIVMTSFLSPFMSAWNGTSSSLLEELNMTARSAHDIHDFKVHRDAFPHPLKLW